MPLAQTIDAALARGRVLIVGVGGLGAPAAAALAEAGAGTLGLADPDLVEASNLHRQPLYDDAVIGRPKVEAAAQRLHTIRPGLGLETHRRACSTLLRFDVIVDGRLIAAKFLRTISRRRRPAPVHAASSARGQS
jgi:adenylyltransferase/sulfurtransferase